MSERSGIDMLEEILHKMDHMEKKIDILDQNIKRVANSAKVAELMQKTKGTRLEDFGRANTKTDNSVKNNTKGKVKISAVGSGNTEERVQKKNFNFEPTDASKLKQQAPSRKGRSSNKSIMVKGKLVTLMGDKHVALPKISVKIFDKNDNLIKTTKTNRAGHWMSQLAPGQYVALFEGEYEGQKLNPINKFFEVPTELPEGQTEFEVK